MTNTTTMQDKEWDAFISHASEDKESLVRPLARLLASYGAKIWYDEFELRIGKSLSRSIDRGIAKSRFGILVLSENFIKKDWPEYELKSLNALELGNDGVILPLWHNVTREQVLHFSPLLADKLALNTGKHDLSELAIKLLEAIRPDIFERVASRAAWNELIKTGTQVSAALNEIRKGPVRHENLPSSLIIRIRFIRAALIDLFPQPIDEWVDDFRRDMHPSSEVLVWERMATLTLEMTQAFNLDHSGRLEVLRVALDASLRGWEIAFKEAEIPNDQMFALKRLVASYPE